MVHKMPLVLCMWMQELNETGVIGRWKRRAGYIGRGWQATLQRCWLRSRVTFLGLLWRETGDLAAPAAACLLLHCVGFASLHKFAFGQQQQKQQ